MNIDGALPTLTPSLQPLWKSVASNLNEIAATIASPIRHSAPTVARESDDDLVSNKGFVRNNGLDYDSHDEDERG